MADEDLLLALRLQERFDREERGSEPLQGARGDPERPLSIVDQSWEVLDPNPDVRALFLEFNRRFFWGKLSGVEVKWSPRMTLCAGVCSYEGRGGLCSIRLSEPLLKLRPRKDLVETLLHEMIHALLFVTQNNRDRDGHGPEFCKHMDRINRASGTRITVYHSFHDEVDAYRQHWWRCDGPCRTRRPYYGYVKRAMNRAPSHLDPWWENHLRTCGGTYTKVKEPEGYGKKEGKKEGSKEKRKDRAGKKTPPPGSGLQDIRSVIPFSGTGFVLGGKSSPVGTPPSSVVPPLRTSSSSSGGRAPGKASVADTRAFVNVNGSPVKIPRRPGGSDRWRQKSIRELFGPTSPCHAPGESSAGTASSQAPPRFSPDKTGSKEKSSGELFRNPSSRPEARRVSSTSTGRLSPDRFRPPEAPRAPSGPSSGPSSGPWSGPSSGPWSGPSSGPWSGTSGPKLFRDSDRGPSSGTSGGASTSRKRSWNEANVSDSFSQTSFRTPPSSSSSSSSSPSPLMVHCPVCLVKVQESKINEHLDSCLS